MQEERVLHEAKLAKMEAEMKMVFQQKVQEKEAKLKQSEEELYARHREMKDQLDKQREDLENKKKKLESGRPLTPDKQAVRSLCSCIRLPPLTMAHSPRERSVSSTEPKYSVLQLCQWSDHGSLTYLDTVSCSLPLAISVAQYLDSPNHVPFSCYLIFVNFSVRNIVGFVYKHTWFCGIFKFDFWWSTCHSEYQSLTL